MEINEQDEGQPLMKDLVLLLCWLYRGCADACFEHVVVAAAHYDRSNASLALRTRLLDAQAAAKARWLPAGLVVVVENDVVERSRIEVERRGLAYARNGGYPGHGFELGAWRWAMSEILPHRDVCADAVVYLVQDSMVMNAPPLAHPPANLTATRLFSFDGTKGLAGVPRSEDHWVPEAETAFARAGSDPAVARSRSRRFPGAFGPNLVGTYAAWRGLLERGFFDMLAVRSKLDEQRSERIVGLFLAVVLGDEGSIGGDYLLVQRPSRVIRAKLPFVKTMAHKARSRDQLHRSLISAPKDGLDKPWANRLRCLEAWQANASRPTLTFVDDERSCGLGCRFLRLAAALVAALDAGRRLALSPSSRWHFGRHADYFEPLPLSDIRLTLPDRHPHHINEWTGPDDVPHEAVFTRASLDNFWHFYRVRRGRRCRHPCLDGLDQCEQAALAAVYLARPNRRLTEAAANVSMEPPYAAVHIRRGDKQRERKGPALSVSAYADALKRFPDLSRVWLMTEDPRVAEESQSMGWHLTEFSRTGKPEATTENIGAVALNSLVNLEVAVNASAFVGADDSTWFRFVLMLAMGRSGRKPRVSSLASGFWTKGGFGNCFWRPDACVSPGGLCNVTTQLFFLWLVLLVGAAQSKAYSGPTAALAAAAFPTLKLQEASRDT